MTGLAPQSQKKLGLVIDLDTCVGCHACAVSCKEWNAGGFAAPLTDERPYGKDPSGVWFNRVHPYGGPPPPAPGGFGCGAGPPETTPAGQAMTLPFPRSCLHCGEPACVT